MNDSLKKKGDTKSKGKKIKLKDKPNTAKGIANNRNGHAKPGMKKNKKSLKNNKNILSGLVAGKKNVEKGGKLGKKQKLKSIKKNLENNPCVVMVDPKSKTIPGAMFMEPKSDVNKSSSIKVETKSQVMNSEIGNVGAVKLQKLKKVVKNSANKESVVKNAELEERAESVDSGCIPDSSSDTVANKTNWLQVKSALLEENQFISNLLKWLPARPPVKEYEVETKKGQKRKQEDGRAGKNKKQRVGVGFVESNADLNELQDRYQNTLLELRKNRKKNQYDPAAKKKQEKITKKLKRLEKRKDKRAKRKLKVVPERSEVKKEEESAKSVTGVKPQKPIYNQNGEMVFSKFDFSSTQHSGSMDFNTKPKDLKQMLSKALKEKEQMKNLEKKGNKEGAATLIDQKAWSNAMKKTEGMKVKTDVDLLKKSIKKQEHRKKTSQKNWEQRQETVQKKLVDKQNTRKKNIAARKDAKLNKKMKKMKKKGHIVPGF